jgi:sec-independent protein translocase protein TatA
MPFGLGLSETVLIFVVVLLFFGPKRLPEMGAAMGKGIRDFKRAISGLELDEQTQEPRSAALAPQAQQASIVAPPAALTGTPTEVPAPAETAVPVETAPIAAPAAEPRA